MVATAVGVLNGLNRTRDKGKRGVEGPNLVGTHWAVVTGKKELAQPSGTLVGGQFGAFQPNHVRPTWRLVRLFAATIAQKAKEKAGNGTGLLISGQGSHVGTAGGPIGLGEN